MIHVRYTVISNFNLLFCLMGVYYILYSSTSTTWRLRDLKRVPRSDLD